jgi:DNA mismatch repair ATPase MutS
LCAKQSNLNRNLQVVGVGFVEPNSRQMQVAQFADSECFGGLECVLLQLAPRELLVPSGVDENDLNNIKAVFQILSLLKAKKTNKNLVCSWESGAGCW